MCNFDNKGYQWYGTDPRKLAARSHICRSPQSNRCDCDGYKECGDYVSLDPSAWCFTFRNPSSWPSSCCIQLCNRDQECATCISDATADINHHCSGNGPLSVCSQQDSDCKCRSGLQSMTDAGQTLAGLDFNLFSNQYGSIDPDRLLGPTFEQARAGEPAVDPDPFSELVQTGPPVAQMSSDWNPNPLDGKTSPPLNLGQTVAAAPDSNDLAPQRSNSNQPNTPTFDSMEPLTDLEQAKKLVWHSRPQSSSRIHRLEYILAKFQHWKNSLF